jgi:4-hydroxy-tetrahydrodipicolinate synthase
MERLVSFLIHSGVHGLFANGSMGGFAFHPDALQIETVEAVCSLAAGRLPVLAGASDTSATRVLEKMRSMAHLPLDTFVVLPPYYYIYDQPALLRFFRIVADRAPRPVVIYENPRLAHNSLSTASILALARHGNICGLKISTGDAQIWQELLWGDLPRERFALIAGAEKMMSLAMRMGFDGMTGGFHNLFAPAAVELYRVARSGQFTEADRLQARINRAYRVFELAGGWRGLEIAFQYMGIAQKAAPPPFDVPPAAEVKAEILAILEREGCPVPYPREVEV